MRTGKAKVLCLIVSFLVVLVTGVGSMVLADNVTITHYVYGSHGPKWQEYLKVMAERFKAETGTTVSFVISPTGVNYESKLLSMIAGGVAPDVSDSSAGHAAPLLGQGVFADLTPYLQRDSLPLDEMPPSALAGCKTPEGLQWGVPVSVFPVITFFNADMFAAAGLANPRELGENWTWDTLTASAKALTVDADGDGSPEQFGTDRIYARWENNVHQAGGQLYDRLVFPTESRFNTPQVQEAVSFLQNLSVNRYATSKWGQSIYTNDVAFSDVNGPGIIGNQMSTVPFQWDVTTQPKGPVNRAASVGPTAFQILANSQHKQEAWQWIRFLVGDAGRQIEMAKITGRFPTLRRAMLAYPQVVESLPANWRVIVDVAFDPNSYSPYMDALSAQTGPIVRNTLDKVWNGKMAPATALEQIHEQLSAIFAEYR